jgi:Extensin-like protein C-terminus
MKSQCENSWRSKHLHPSRSSKLTHSTLTGQAALTNSRRNTAIYPGNRRVNFIFPLMILFVLGIDPAVAESVPWPRPRPSEAPTSPLEEVPSACRVRLTSELAVAPSVSNLNGSGECDVTGVVRLEAVILRDGRRVAIRPPATLRCEMAESVVHWVRDDVAGTVQELGAPLGSIDNYSSYNCRGRNNIVGAQLSEHGKANALDIHSFRLLNGKIVELTDPHIARDFREITRKSACGRFFTVLGPGSDGYHEDHVHVDLRQRTRGYRLCQWDVRDPEPPSESAAASQVPLPPPRPKFEAKRGKS